jgi:uncharacterized protein (DUF58 family)
MLMAKPPGPGRARGAPPGQPRFRFHDPVALQGLHNLRLAARRIVEGSFAGRHRSRMRGSSVEFADYREYTPGDDLRRLDWKAFARLGRPFLRTFDEETNLRCLFILDTSASMDFGAQGHTRLSKLDYARFFLAAMAYLVIQCRDQAGLAFGADSLEFHLEPRASRHHLDLLLNALEKVRPVPRTRLPALLQGLFPLTRRRSMLIVCSDFIENDPAEMFRMLRLYRHRHFEVILFHLLDPQERDLPSGASYRFLDPEGPAAVNASPAEIRDGYRERLEAWCANIRQQALGCGCEYERIETDTPYPEALRKYLQFRESL